MRHHQGAGNDLSEQEQERRKLRRLQIMMNMVMSVISQDEGLTVEEAAELAANAKRAALALFPDKEFAYDILYKPRLAAADGGAFSLAVELRLFGDAGQIDGQRAPEKLGAHLDRQMAIIVRVPNPNSALVLQDSRNRPPDPPEPFEMFRPAF